MRRLSILLLVVLFTLVLMPAARGQSANFDVAQHGKTVGSAGYSFTAGSQGIQSASLVRVSMQGLNYALSKNESLTADHHLLQVSLSATVNGSAVTLTAEAKSGQLVLTISANGRKTNTPLRMHAGAVLLADFDPGALQTLLTVAEQQNGRDLWAIVPKQTGSVVPVQLATLADLQGTLSGKPVTVHHLQATISGAKTELFTGVGDELLQAELPQEGFALVRKGFVLQPPARAPAPPPQPQSAPQPQTAPVPQQPQQ